ncbi:rRNA small subunit methyltransferase B, partial [Escherichia coli]|nr:rRNA small subunit methyltransferase B [Escherichia coli]
MDTDAYAAVDTSVNLVRSVAGEAPAGLVNAVLRKVSTRTDQQWLKKLSAQQPGSDEQLALEFSHPTWIV